MKPISEVTNEDCLKMMARFPDKYFDLAITDPPYGININASGRLGHYGGKGKKWDDKTPDEKYFTELVRVSKNQIVWGGNYFDLPPSRHFLIWDKQQPEGVSFAGCEYAWSSFDESAKIFRQRPQGDDRIHPTQKPVQLYKWLLTNYAKAGDKILDTHIGSGSSRIAAYNMGFDFYGTELDPDYFQAMEKRFKEQTKQSSLFDWGLAHSSYPESED